MPISAYVLMNTAMGKAAEVAEEVAKINGVVKVQCVTGQLDAIAFIEADNINEIGKLVANQIQNVPGITGTITCPAIDLG